MIQASVVTDCSKAVLNSPCKVAVRVHSRSLHGQPEALLAQHSSLQRDVQTSAAVEWQLRQQSTKPGNIRVNLALSRHAKRWAAPLFISAELQQKLDLH